MGVGPFMGGIMFVVGVGALPEDQTLVSEDSTVVPHLPTLDSGGGGHTWVGRGVESNSTDSRSATNSD